MYRRISLVVILIVCYVFSTPTIGQTYGEVQLSAKSAILIEETTGRVLFEKDAHVQLPIASVTKIMTAIIALEYGNLHDDVFVSERAIQTGGSSIYLQRNEKISLEDLLYGLMLRSGNDAAVAIAEHIGGSVEGFVYLMNEKAQLLGMENTHFMNPHGLDEDGHYSTAYDLAILMKYAMQHTEFQEISNTKSYVSKNRAYSWLNKNKLLTEYFEYCTGGKTGYTKKAGRTLVTTATDEKLRLIAVTLNAPNDWQDHQNLYEYGFQTFILFPLANKGKKQYRVASSTYEGKIKENVYYPLEKRELHVLHKKVMIRESSSRFETEREPLLGREVFLLHDEQIIDVPIYSVTKKELSLFSHAKRFIERLVKEDENG